VATCAATLLSALSAGCGGDLGTSKGITVRTSAPASAKRVSAGAAAGSPRAGAADLRPTRAQALAFARTVNLTSGDLPEAHAAARKRTRSEHVDTAKCERGLANAPEVAATGSPWLVRGSELEKEEIASSVAVRPDDADAMRSIALARNARVRECFARALTRHYAGRRVGEARLGPISVTPLPMQAPGMDAAAGLRAEITVNFTLSEVTLPIYVDVFGFADGPAEVFLSTISATQPVPAATEQRLFAVLAARAAKHLL
jgi:hypothetical protein